MEKMLGGILQAVGILIAGASGLCSLYFLTSMVGGPGNSGPESGFFAILIIFIGGLPCASGIALFFAGRSIIRRANSDAEDGFK